MEAAIERNAFRVLSLPADAQAKEVYRQQQRLQNALEIGDGLESPFAFIPPIPLSVEAVLEAVHRVERRRAVEELFWIHNLGGKFDFRSGALETILANLRAQAAQNTTKGSVAQHNLAVILTCLAQKLNGSRRLDYWKDAVGYWSSTLSNSVFWQFIEDREELSNGNGGPHTNELRGIVRETIQKLILKEIWNAIDEREYKAIGSLSAVVRKNTVIFAADTLDVISTRMAKDASVGIGGVLDRVSALTKETEKSVVRTALIAAENHLRKIRQDFDAIAEAFGGTTGFAGVYDAQATALKRVSVEYFNILDDASEALRLVTEARSLARDVNLQRDLEAGWKHIRRSLLCSEALVLLETKHYVEAQEKLAIALTLSTEEQKEEVQEMQEGVHRATVFQNVDPTKRSPSLHTINGVGATFYGKRDFDEKTKSYITVHWFVFLFLPVIPLARYRVSDSGSNQYMIYGQVPLSPFLRKYIWGVLIAILLLFLLVIIGNSDAGGSSASYVDRSTNAPTYSPASSQDSPRNAESDNSDPGGGGVFKTPAAGQESPNAATALDSLPAEKQAIEAERDELKSLSDSLDARKQQLDEDSSELDRMKAYVRSVKDTYTDETVPDSIRGQYNSTVDEYNTKLPEYNAAASAYNDDLQRYKSKVAEFNERVERYNAKP